MLPEELDLYLRQMNTRLKPMARAMLTFFVLKRRQEELRFKNAIDFRKSFPDAVYAVRSALAPSAAVAYEEEYLTRILDENRLGIDQIHYGYWSGWEHGLSFQDLFVVRKLS